MNGHRRRPVLLLLSANERFVRKAGRLGMDVVHLEDPSLVDPAPAPLCLRSEQVPLLDVEQVVRRAEELHHEYSFTGVLTNHEPAVPAAEAAAAGLSLTAPGKGVAGLLQDKSRMRRALLDSPELAVPWAPLERREDLDAAGRALGYPLVLKPAHGSASLGVVKVDGPHECGEAWERVVRARANEHRYHELLPVTGYLAEPFFTGREFSVETFSRDGVHEVYAVVGKVLGTSFVEAGHIVPAPVGEAEARAVREKVLAFLDLTGLENGPAHTELIVGERGIHIVESHARTAGDEIPELVRLTTGRDLELDMLAHYGGLAPPPAARPRTPAAAKTYLEAGAEGVFAGLDGRDEALGVPGVVTVEAETETGARVGGTTASWDRVAQVVAVGRTADEAWDAASAAARLLRVRLRSDTETGEVRASAE